MFLSPCPVASTLNKPTGENDSEELVLSAFGVNVAVVVEDTFLFRSGAISAKTAGVSWKTTFTVVDLEWAHGGPVVTNRQI